jgi:hypothetical protein
MGGFLRAIAFVIFCIVAIGAMEGQKSGSPAAHATPPQPLYDVSGSPAIKAFVNAMMPFQYHVYNAQLASVCRLRSEVYYADFWKAREQFAQKYKSEFGLPPQDEGKAYAEVNRIFGKVVDEVSKFDLNTKCEGLRAGHGLDQLDQIHQRLISNDQ